MIDGLPQSDRALIHADINAQTGKIPWRELQRFFAAGKVMRVSADLDLVEVACAIGQDDVERVRAWTDRLELAPVSDDEAREWLGANATLWAVVVKPWVLVQTIDPA